MVQQVRQMAQETSQQLSSTPKGAEFDRVYIESRVRAVQQHLERARAIHSQRVSSR